MTERATRINTSREAFERMMGALDQPARPLPLLGQAAQWCKESVDADPELCRLPVAELQS